MTEVPMGLIAFIVWIALAYDNRHFHWNDAEDE